MLIYVDKKKERQRKIKIFCIISFIIIFISLNIFSFRNYLHHTGDALINYQQIKHQNNWYDKTSPIYVFSSKKNSSTSIIIIPSTINREDALTLGNTFNTLPKQNYFLQITDNIKDQTFLRQIAEITLPKTAPDQNTAELIITNDITEIQDKIDNFKLYPKAYSYTKAIKLQNTELTNLLNKYYPPQPKPQTQIEKEQKALATFVEENKKDLIDFILKDISPKFSKQSIFLESTRLCLQGYGTTICQMQSETSLLLNIKNALERFPENIKPQKLILLSSNEKIHPDDIQNLETDEGLYFHFNRRTAFLLPDELSVLTIEKEPLYILKEKAGFNPEYTSPQMELYKFKITEVNLDEEI